MRRSTPEFEADVDPTTGWPRLRFNFSNGYSGSLVIRTRGCDAMQASLAACPTGEWGSGETVLGPTEATADEAIAWLGQLSRDWPTIISNPSWPTEPARGGEA